LHSRLGSVAPQGRVSGLSSVASLTVATSLSFSRESGLLAT